MGARGRALAAAPPSTFTSSRCAHSVFASHHNCRRSALRPARRNFSAAGGGGAAFACVRVNNA
jgi:hypothetical protein